MWEFASRRRWTQEAILIVDFFRGPLLVTIVLLGERRCSTLINSNRKYSEMFENNRENRQLKSAFFGNYS